MGADRRASSPMTYVRTYGLYAESSGSSIYYHVLYFVSWTHLCPTQPSHAWHFPRVPLGKPNIVWYCYASNASGMVWYGMVWYGMVKAKAESGTVEKSSPPTRAWLWRPAQHTNACKSMAAWGRQRTGERRARARARAGGSEGTRKQPSRPSFSAKTMQRKEERSPRADPRSMHACGCQGTAATHTPDSFLGKETTT
jgi:hypothetical protein